MGEVVQAELLRQVCRFMEEVEEKKASTVDKYRALKVGVSVGIIVENEKTARQLRQHPDLKKDEKKALASLVKFFQAKQDPQRFSQELVLMRQFSEWLLTSGKIDSTESCYKYGI